MVDELGGMMKSGAFLAERKVSKDLPVLDWEAPSGALSFGPADRSWPKRSRGLGYEAFPTMKSLEKTGLDKVVS